MHTLTFSANFANSANCEMTNHKQIIKDIPNIRTDIKGKVSIKIDKRVSYLELKEGGLIPNIIPVKDIKGKDIEILMTDCDFIEDKELIFIIKSLNKDQFELKSTDCITCGSTRKLIFTKRNN